MSEIKDPDKYGVHLGPFDNSRYRWRTRLIFWLGLHFAWIFAFRFHDSSKIGIIGKDLEDDLIQKKRGIIYAYWHRYSQFYFFHVRQKRHIMMISAKQGGEFGARCMAKIGVIAIRGSPKKVKRDGRVVDKKGKAALDTMVKLVRDEGFHAGLTVDGSKGPAFVMKIGAVNLAADTGSPIIILTAAAKPHFNLPSWDKMWMPVPFSKIVYFFTGPFYVPKNADNLEREEIRLKIERHMRDMAKKAGNYFKDEKIRKKFPEPLWL